MTKKDKKVVEKKVECKECVQHEAKYKALEAQATSVIQRLQIHNSALTDKLVANENAGK